MATIGSRSPRADAERNRARILEQAARLIAADPDVTMVQIAEASQVGRATLYRHFASRDEVVDALREDAFTRAQSIITDAIAPRDGTGAGPAAKLGRVISELLSMSEPYGLIADKDPRHHQEARETFDATVLPLIEAAQAAGELTDKLPALGIGFALEGLMLSANRGVRQGELTSEQGVTLVQLGMLRGFAADAS